MAYHLDTLKNNDNVYVVFNSCNGSVCMFYNLISLVDAMWSSYSIRLDKLRDKLSRKEIVDFFEANDIEIDYVVLEQLFREDD